MPNTNQRWTWSGQAGHPTLMLQCIKNRKMINMTDFTFATDRKNRVFISGPMSGYALYNFPAFNTLAKQLTDQGMIAVNPADIGVVEGAEWEDYVRATIRMLMTCERVHVLPNWQESRGACLEIDIATQLGMPITFEE